MLGRQLETGKNVIFKTFKTQERHRRELKFGEHRVNILILSGDNKPQKSSCLPSGKHVKKLWLACIHKRTQFISLL